MLLNFIGLVLATAGAAWMFYLVVSGFRRGRIHHSDSTSTYSIRRQPARFLFVALLFTVFGAVFLYAAVLRFLEICHGF
jgi:hypothetical protein